MTKRDSKMSTASFTDEDVTGVISKALQKKLLHVRNPYHWLSERYGWGTRKGKAIVRGEYCPKPLDLLTLMRDDDDVWEAVTTLINRQALPDDKAARIRAILEEQ